MGKILLGLFFMLTGVVLYAAVLRRTRDALHPLALLGSFWLIAFGYGHWDVASTYDEPYYAEPFTALTYLVVLGSLACAAAGFWLADPGLRPVERSSVAARLRTSWDPLRMGVLALVSFALATATTLYFVRVAGEIPLFSPRVDELRQVFKLPLLGYLYDLHLPAALFGAMLAGRARGRAEKLLWMALVAASLFQLAFGAVRASPMAGVGWVAVYLFYRHGERVPLRYLVAGAIVVAFVFTGIEYYRRTPFRLNPELANPRQDRSPAALLWGHTGASYKNLQITLRSPSPLRMGTTSYGLPGTLVPELKEGETEVSSTFGVHNSATYLMPLWLDFGVFGVFVVPGIYGALLAAVYRRFLTRTNLFWLLVHIDFLAAAALAFRTHKFLSNNLVFFAGFALVAQFWAGRAPQRAASPRSDARSDPLSTVAGA